VPSAITSTEIADGTIVNADVNASAAIDGTKISPNFGSQNIVTSGTVDGRDVSADGTKLDGIETGATADQTNAEIKTAYEANSNTNAYTDAEKTKLSGIETSATADQTGAEIKTAYEGEANTNAFTDAEKTKLSNLGSLNALSDVNTSGVADGKILKYNASSNAFIIADDGGGTGSGITNGDKGDITVAGAGTVSESFTIDSNAVTTAKIADEAVTLAKLPHGTSSTDGKFLRSNNGADPTFETVNTNLVADTTPQLGGNLDVQASEINTSTTNGNIKLNPNGTGVVEIKGDGSSADGTLQLNCSQNSHGVKIKSPPHSASASYTLTLPNNIVNGQFLKTDTNGNLSWAAVDLTALSASNLTSGTVPDARFPATLPAASGTNLTNLPSGNLTGALPAISGASLTSLNASNLGSGTIPDARFPATLPALDGSNLTGLASTVAGGAIYENSQTISASHTIPSGSNGMSAGPVTVNNGITLTISSGSTYTVV
jgi:hypothetical protein